MKELVFAMLLAAGPALAEETKCEDIGQIQNVQSKLGFTVVTTKDEQYTYNFAFVADMAVSNDNIGADACYDHKRNQFCYTVNDVLQCDKVVVNKE